MALSQNHLVAAGTRKGKEALSSGHVALSYCLQMPTIKLFPDRSGSANSLGSGKMELQGIREVIWRDCRIPLPRNLKRHYPKLPVTWAKSPDSGRV